MIVIVDYGLGNVRAFANAYSRLGLAAQIVREPADLARATRLILPGVGAFDHAMALLRRSGMIEPLRELVEERKVPVLGVCVGMQILANGSEEGSEAGLGWIRGQVRRFDATQAGMRVPHMGWNNLSPVGVSRLLVGLDATSRFYFLHSYYFHPLEPERAIGLTQYHGSFVSAAARDNVFGVQFHPEKSHSWGLRLLENFAHL